MNFNFNSPFVQGALRFGMSKLGPFLLSGATWLAAHILLWFGLPHFVPADQLQHLQDSLTKYIDGLAMTFVAIVYAWLVHRQSQGTRTLKAMLDASPVPTPDMVMDSGAIGNQTLLAAEEVTGVSVQRAAQLAGVTRLN